MKIKKKQTKEESGIFKQQVKLTHIDEIWEVIEEIQDNLNYINLKLDRILGRMGLQDE